MTTLPASYSLELDPLYPEVHKDISEWLIEKDFGSNQIDDLTDDETLELEQKAALVAHKLIKDALIKTGWDLKAALKDENSEQFLTVLVDPIPVPDFDIVVSVNGKVVK